MRAQVVTVQAWQLTRGVSAVLPLPGAVERVWEPQSEGLT